MSALAATLPAHRAAAHLGTRDLAIAYTVRGRRQMVLQGVGLDIARGAFVSLIGASGCGKSTLLKVFAGLIQPTAGTVEVAGVSPQEAVRAAEMLELVGLRGAADKLPRQLSGGMQQRVAIARALTLDPEILLMDEPFGALDAITREEMSHSLLEIWERTKKTIVLVTHSINEAVLLSTEVHVMGLRPARVVETLRVELPQPRGAESFRDPRFGALEAQLRHLLLESHAHRRIAR